MLTQLLNLAETHLNGVDREIPDLLDLDSKSVSSVTSQTVINTIMQQARKGNVGGLREMLSGSETTSDHLSIERLKGPVATQLQNRLNISGDTAAQLAAMALPVIMNMLNHKVQSAQSGGLNIHDAIGQMSGKGGGLMNVVSGLLNSNRNNKTINSILQNLIN